MIFGLGKPRQSVVRPLRADRAADCAVLHQEGFAHPWSAQEFEALLRDRSVIAAAALDAGDGAMRGFVLARQAADEAEILTIAVARAAQGHGLGRALMAYALRQAANAGARTLFLEVDADNAPAIALYRRHGFATVGERPGYYRRKDGGRATALVMSRPIA